MTAVPDLGPCPYGLNDPALRAVGWLGPGDKYPRGTLSGEAFEKLEMLCAAAWQPFEASCGHPCDLCELDAPILRHLLFVPGKGCIYVAPLGIIHYITAHGYLPPDVFIQAVLECPAMTSADYHQAILTNGGGNLKSYSMSDAHDVCFV